MQDLLEWKNLTLTGVYGAEPVTMDELKAVDGRITARRSSPSSATPAYICARHRQKGKKILFEAQLGALRDLDYGIYPYTTSSNAIAAYAPVGSGLPTAKIDEVIGVVKAYSTCVGEGPFVCEMFGAEADARCGRPASSTARRPAVPAGSAPSTWWPPATAFRCRARPTSP